MPSGAKRLFCFPGPRAPAHFRLGHLHAPTVLRNEWIIPNNTIVCVRTAIEKAVSPDGLG